jgi:hypothetical protein
MVPLMGKFRVRLDGFLEEDYQGLDTKKWYRNITLTITSREGREMRWAIDSPSPFTLNLGCGTWGARLTGNNLGSVERSIEVMHGMVSELMFFRTDLVLAQR